MYYFIVDIGKDSLTGKNKKENLKPKQEADKALAVALNELNLDTFIEPPLIDLNSFIRQ